MRLHRGERHAHERQVEVVYEPESRTWLVRHDDDTLSRHVTQEAAERWGVQHALEHGEKAVAVHGMKGALLWMRPVR